MISGVTASAGVLFGLPPSVASAAPVASSTVVVSHEFDSDASDHLGGTVLCPAGYRMVGSGVATGEIGFSAVTAMAPTGDFSGATFVTNRISLPRDTRRTATLYVRCAPAEQFADVIVVQTNDHRVTAGVFSEGISRCPAGYFGFGGGGYYLSFSTGLMGAAASNSTNAPSADGSAWTYAGVAPQGASVQVTIIQCAPRTGRDFLVQFGNESHSRFRATTSSVSCPSGYTAISGGFYVSNSDGSVSSNADEAVSAESTNTPGSWFATGLAPIGTKVVALAQCLL
jgi:hypothetical protein